MTESVCPKRPFRSIRKARLACKTLGARVRVYHCPHCDRLHVANAHKSHDLRLR